MTNKNRDNEWITIKEASEQTKVPLMKIVNLIRQDLINGIIVNGIEGFIQRSELKYLK